MEPRETALGIIPSCIAMSIQPVLDSLLTQEHTLGANEMTNEQIAASRDYNLSVLWFWNRRAGIKPTEIAADHEKLLVEWYDKSDRAAAHPRIGLISHC